MGIAGIDCDNDWACGMEWENDRILYPLYPQQNNISTR